MGWGFKDRGFTARREYKEKYVCKINSLLNNLDQQVNDILIFQA